MKTPSWHRRLNPFEALSDGTWHIWNLYHLSLMSHPCHIIKAWSSITRSGIKPVGSFLGRHMSPVSLVIDVRSPSWHQSHLCVIWNQCHTRVTSSKPDQALHQVGLNPLEAFSDGSSSRRLAGLQSTGLNAFHCTNPTLHCSCKVICTLHTARPCAVEPHNFALKSFYCKVGCVH